MIGSTALRVVVGAAVCSLVALSSCTANQNATSVRSELPGTPSTTSHATSDPETVGHRLPSTGLNLEQIVDSSTITSCSAIDAFEGLNRPGRVPNEPPNNIGLSPSRLMLRSPVVRSMPPAGT